jgi:hypothetical protein
MKNCGLIITSILSFVLVGCGDSTDNKSPSITVIEGEYSNYVIDKEITNLICVSKVMQNHEFILCTYGEGRWPHKGLWMVDGGHFYALNGKALTALDKLKHNSNFSQLPPRMDVNVSGVMSAFESGVLADNLVKEVSEQAVSQKEINAYCSYMKEKDNLTIQANSRFGEDNPLSKERAAWIEPKIVEIQNRYFEAQGLKYHDVFGKVASARIRCTR